MNFEYKCKKCGVTVDDNEDNKIVLCPSCNSVMTKKKRYSIYTKILISILIIILLFELGDAIIQVSKPVTPDINGVYRLGYGFQFLITAIIMGITMALICPLIVININYDNNSEKVSKRIIANVIYIAVVVLFPIIVYLIATSPWALS